MESKGVRRMIGVDEAGNACGLVSSDDRLQLVAWEMNGLGRLVERQLENEKNNLIGRHYLRSSCFFRGRKSTSKWQRSTWFRE
jgi:hypothetical protein